MANLIGQKLGNYEIIGFLGEGGMASVYRAHQLTVKRDVAIKVIKAGLGDTAQFMQRFSREAQTVAALNHPHILKVFDYGQEGDLAYLVMELQPGGSLAGLIEAGRISTARIATILDQVGSALDYAHRQGIVHRDLKPQNILFDPDGNAILTDFGIAKLLNANSSALTQSGAAIGTPTYMAPEQWQGLPVDGRTDIYALGVVLFQMLSGQLPFQGDTPFSVMHKHIYDTPPSVVSDRPQLPEAVDLVVRTAMAKDPENRFKSAEEMALSFKAALAGQAPTKTVSTTAAPITTIIPPSPTAVSQPPSQIGNPQLANPPIARRGNTTLLVAVGLVVAAIVVVGGGVAVLGNRTTPTPTSAPTSTVVPTVAVAVVPSATSTGVPPSTTATASTVLTTAVPTTVAPTITNTTDPRETHIAQTQIALQTNAAIIVNAQAQLTAAAALAIIQAATLNAATKVVTTTPIPTTVVPTVAPTNTPSIIATTAVPTSPPPTVAPTSAPPTIAPTQPIVQSNGSVTFANQAKGAFLDSLTMNLSHIPLPGEGKQYVAWLSDRVHAPVRLGKLIVRADGTAQLTYADPKGVNLLATYSVAYITSQSSATATAQDPVVFSGGLPPLASVHVQHVLTHFPDTPGNIGLMIGALEQADILTEHANLLGEAIKQGNVALAKLHMEHIYNILTGTDGAKDINGDGVLTISPPSDGYGLLNYLTNALEHANLAVEQPDATNDMKVIAKRLGTAVANVTKNYTQIQALIIQAAAKKLMIEIKPLMAQLVILNNAAMNGSSAITVTPDPDSAQFDGLLNAYAQAAALGTISLFPGNAALKIPATPGAATTGPSGTAAPTMAGMSMVMPTADLNATPLAPPSTATATSLPANTVVILLQDQAFSPDSVTVKVGTVVVFSNQSLDQHTATADDGSFETGVIQPGTESKPIIMNEPGTFAYFCEFHGGPGGVGMSGIITVQ